MSISKIKEINKIVEDMIWAELSKRTYQCSCEKRDISSSVMLKKDWVEFTKPLSMKITQQILSLIEELEGKKNKIVIKRSPRYVTTNCSHCKKTVTIEL